MKLIIKKLRTENLNKKKTSNKKKNSQRVGAISENQFLKY